MKYLAVIVMSLSLILTGGAFSGEVANAETPSLQQENEQNNMKMEALALTQEKLKNKLNNQLKTLSLSEEDLLKEGGFYYNEKGQIVLQIKKSAHNQKNPVLSMEQKPTSLRI